MQQKGKDIAMLSKPLGSVGEMDNSYPAKKGTNSKWNNYAFATTGKQAQTFLGEKTLWCSLYTYILNIQSLKFLMFFYMAWPTHERHMKFTRENMAHFLKLCNMLLQGFFSSP